MLGPALSLGQPGGGPPPALFVLDQARMEPVEQWREVTGELRALRRASVASRQAGQLTEVLIDDGVTVATGQVIAHPDSSLAKLELDRAIASERAKRESVAVRERELDRWKREWARYEKLEGNQSVSESEVDQVRSQVVVGEGMKARGYDADFAERCFEQVKGFSSYGFPESHAASFALLVYVSCWLKHHRPAAFAAALINSQPMGFFRLISRVSNHPQRRNHILW